MTSSMRDKPYTFSMHISAVCSAQMRTFADLADKLDMDVTDLMKECNGKSHRRKPWSKVCERNGHYELFVRSLQRK